jgi:hypothetical protein
MRRAARWCAWNHRRAGQRHRCGSGYDWQHHPAAAVRITCVLATGCTRLRSLRAVIATGPSYLASLTPRPASATFRCRTRCLQALTPLSADGVTQLGGDELVGKLAVPLVAALLKAAPSSKLMVGCHACCKLYSACALPKAPGDDKAPNVGHCVLSEIATRIIRCGALPTSVGCRSCCTNSVATACCTRVCCCPRRWCVGARASSRAALTRCTQATAGAESLLSDLFSLASVSLYAPSVLMRDACARQSPLRPCAKAPRCSRTGDAAARCDRHPADARGDRQRVLHPRGAHEARAAAFRHRRHVSALCVQTPPSHALADSGTP